MTPDTRTTEREHTHGSFKRLCGRLALALLISLLCFRAFTAVSQEPAIQFAEANRLYDQGHFEEAAAAYEQMLEAGVRSPTLYFNLGNARFKAGQIGLALAAYRIAERGAPRDPDIRANLQFARNQVQGPTAARPLWQRWLARLTLNEWTLLAAAPLWIGLLIAVVIQLKPALKQMLRPGLLGFGFLAIAGCICLAAALQQSRSQRLAFVVVKEASVRQGPLDEAQSAFVLHDGAELDVLDQKDDWLRVSTNSRRVGWIKKTEVRQLAQSSS